MFPRLDLTVRVRVWQDGSVSYSGIITNAEGKTTVAEPTSDKTEILNRLSALMSCVAGDPANGGTLDS